MSATATPNSFCETISKIIRPCAGFMCNFTLRHRVHPLEPVAPHSEYLPLDNRKYLRIIHIKPTVTARSVLDITENAKRVSRTSLSEEYWFTRWNKPLKTGNCNCSFRRSQQFSGLPLSVYRSKDENEIDDFNYHNSKTAPTSIINVETFVERLIEETLFEAFQEYFMKRTTTVTSRSRSCCFENLAYETDKHEIEDVVLRRPVKHSKDDVDNSVSYVRNPSTSRTTNCYHKTEHSKRKPVIMLLHGIGSSADVWWSIISTLMCKGYEIVAPDMLGHGYSSVPDKPSAYKFKNLLKYTLAVFDRYVGCDESNNCIVIAHSYGCSLATALCRYRSQQITQLILISGGGPTPLAPPVEDRGMSTFRLLQTLLKPLLICGIKRTLFYSSRGKNFDVCNETNAVPKYILKYIAHGQNWPEGDAAFHRRILIPTLLVHGLQDARVTLVQECEMERTIPRAFLELIPNAGHMCMLETPEHLSHMIICFIDWWSR